MNLLQKIKELEEKGYESRTILDMVKGELSFESDYEKGRKEGYLEAQHDIIPVAVKEAREKLKKEIIEWIRNSEMDGFEINSDLREKKKN